MSRFKIGDKVRLKSNYDYFYICFNDYYSLEEDKYLIWEREEVTNLNREPYNPLDYVGNTKVRIELFYE